MRKAGLVQLLLSFGCSLGLSETISPPFIDMVVLPTFTIQRMVITILGIGYYTFWAV
ncbi:hypothetical protein BDV33DRAFT_178907 [Aspergillus novoparasiticus]|uniref:Major facilitator superfamily (MFS) profile domain-containing protein n=1 Tax=Aspergillus novoparasiticus TaxID=986946 RepID=A0A5N6EHV8_9EURO|nr:hypothetical protein BDV33DRAFT_178907 [Aspergillus novoparasiticus]